MSGKAEVVGSVGAESEIWIARVGVSVAITVFVRYGTMGYEDK